MKEKKCTKSALRAQDWDPAHPNALITYRILLITDALRAQDWDPAHPNALITYRILLITDAPHAVRTIASLAAFITCRRRIADWRGSFAASLALRGPSLFIVCAKNGTALFLPTGMGRTVRDVLQTVRQEKRCHSSSTSTGISSLEGQSVVPSSSIT